VHFAGLIDPTRPANGTRFFSREHTRSFRVSNLAERRTRAVCQSASFAGL
jgi:hypothetical protein